MKNQKGFRKILAALLLLVMLFTALYAFAGGKGPENAGKIGESITELTGSGEAALQAKKKKTTATPRPTATPKPTATPAGGGVMTPTPVPEGPIIDPQSIADYIFAHGELPENFITKKEARALGWDKYKNDLSDVAPGMSIGGDYFGNYEGLLPTGEGIEYHEADCWYTEGDRNAFRIIYSSDGRVWYTEDHYNTFTELFPTVPTPEPEAR